MMGQKIQTLTLFLGRNPFRLLFCGESKARGLGLINSNFSRATNDFRKIAKNMRSVITPLIGVMLSHQWGKDETLIQHYPMSKNLTGVKMDHTTYISIYKLDLLR